MAEMADECRTLTSHEMLIKELGPLKLWEKVGEYHPTDRKVNKRGQARFGRRFPNGEEVPPDYVEECVCKVPIVHNCWIYRPTTADMVVVGNCCFKRFTDAEARLQRCRLCGQQHRNRKEGLCNACGKCECGIWLPEYEPDNFCKKCFDRKGDRRPPPPPPPPPNICEVCGPVGQRALNHHSECDGCCWQPARSASGREKWCWLNSSYGLCPDGRSLWANSRGEMIPRRFLSPDLSHQSIRMFLEKREKRAGELRRHDDECVPIIPRRPPPAKPQPRSGA